MLNAMRHTSAIGVVFIWAIYGLRVLPAQDIEFDERKLDDVICGPRCVEFVLRHYDQRGDELVDLIREMQWPEFEAGSALFGVQYALEKRHVSTYAMQLPAGARLRWKHPVILHLADQENSLGHFVVWLPSSTPGAAHVWTGLPGIQIGRTSQLFAEPRVVLLTAPEPIVDPRLAIVNFDVVGFWTMLTILGLTAIAAILTVYLARQWIVVRAFRKQAANSAEVLRSTQKGSVRC
ncbi:MAG: cysteine peptidase family C39 domain-containing protein [Planctomycetota bacterium]|nr:cysteine peptidase family C39 domain-containing protein [Planctomycetota bacterium]